MSEKIKIETKECEYNITRELRNCSVSINYNKMSFENFDKSFNITKSEFDKIKLYNKKGLNERAIKYIEQLKRREMY